MYNNSLAPAKTSTGPGNAPRNADGHSAPIVQAPKDRHENAPRREQKGFVDDLRTHSALNGSTNGAEQHAPQGQKLLNPAEIQECFEALNCELGREPKFLKGCPASIAILGGALATEHLKRGAGTSVIEVLIDPRTTDKDRLAYIRACMRRMKVFREFDRPDGTKTKHEWFFEKKQFRNDMFKGSLRNERFQGQHCNHYLEVYAVAATDAFEIEMRRLGATGQDGNAALSNAVSILGGLTGCGVNPKERNWCRNLCQVKKRAPIPPESIEKVANRFFDHYKKDGIVGSYH
ncbi:hypothetical protein Daus18300_010942 [Diaporthe australafricana]|uniref:Uncharacterized protein n=1 Tax=Diaporthe australafricana TaxID=127596 RepID=A0ABR3W8S7_9PEZI